MTTTLTSKGQVTIPHHVRRQLEAGFGAQMIVILEGDRVFIRRGGSYTDRTAGMFRATRGGVVPDAATLRRRAERAEARDSARRMGD